MKKSETLEAKRAVKKVTGLLMKDISITSFWKNNYIGYKYYATNYDRVTNRYTHGTVVA